MNWIFWKSWAILPTMRRDGIRHESPPLFAVGHVADRHPCPIRRYEATGAAGQRDAEDDRVLARNGNDQAAGNDARTGSSRSARRTSQKYLAAKAGSGEKQGGPKVKFFVRSAIPFGVAALLLAAPAWSQTVKPDPAPAQSEQESLDRWQKMSPDEKQETRERFERWKSLGAKEKADLQDKFENWRKLPPEEQAAARRNFERYQKL
ncbi:MAG TPA: DUF3106 domain-containing protein, partial [Candidatus Binatia bacterium]|nr:DUF3106 domain-containing protein [Candidatus Binatia bacterium]